MLYNVFDFADKEVSDVMVPRPEVVAIAVDMPPEECLKTAVSEPYTRYPVYRGSLDEIVGVLHVRDLFRAAEESGGIENVVIEPLLRTTHVVPETKDLAALLREFRRTKEHMAVVVDEYGAMEGIVTLEDLLEEIVGEIEDEFDLPDESVEKVDENRIRIHGTFTIDDFNEEFHVSLPEEDYNTVGGFVFGELGHAPHEGDSVVHDDVRFTVFETDGNRIERLEVEFKPVAGAHDRPDRAAGSEAGPEADEAA
jgi:putative hemolysin